MPVRRFEQAVYTLNEIQCYGDDYFIKPTEEFFLFRMGGGGGGGCAWFYSSVAVNKKTL